MKEPLEPIWILEKWEHGWLIKAPPFARGVPMDILTELQHLFCKGAIVDAVIGNTLDAIFGIAKSKAAAEIWRKEISEDPRFKEKFYRTLEEAKNS